MTGIGIAGCESGCGCIPKPPTYTPTPPPDPEPGLCDYAFECEAGDPLSSVTFNLECTLLGNDNSCFENCDECSTTPFDIVLDPSTLTMPFKEDCLPDYADEFSDLDAWIGGECNDTCYEMQYTGTASASRTCDRVDDDILCPVPPYGPSGFSYTSLYIVYVWLFVWRDLCFKMIIAKSSLSYGGGTTPDPDDPTNEANACYTHIIETYEGTLTCCGVTSLSAGPISFTCSSTPEGNCVPVCAIIPGSELEMVCP